MPFEISTLKLYTNAIWNVHRFNLSSDIDLPWVIGRMYEYWAVQDYYHLGRHLQTTVQYTNSLDLDETLSNSAFYRDPSYLTRRQHFHQFWATFKHFEYLSRREIYPTDNWFGRLRVKQESVTIAHWSPHSSTISLSNIHVLGFG